MFCMDRYPLHISWTPTIGRSVYQSGVDPTTGLVYRLEQSGSRWILSWWDDEDDTPRPLGDGYDSFTSASWEAQRHRDSVRESHAERAVAVHRHPWQYDLVLGVTTNLFTRQTTVVLDSDGEENVTLVIDEGQVKALRDALDRALKMQSEHHHLAPIL